LLLRSTVLAWLLLFGMTGGVLVDAQAEPKTNNPGADGRAAFAVRDFGKAGPLLVEAALGGDVAAHRMLGEIYSSGGKPGSGGPDGRDECAALVWYDQAARMGDGLAMRRMARAYRRGCGVKRDERMAVLWAQFAEHVGAPPVLANPLAEAETPVNAARHLHQKVINAVAENGAPSDLPLAEIYFVPSFLWNDPDVAAGLLERGLAPCDGRPAKAPRAQPSDRLELALMKGLVLKAVSDIPDAQRLFADMLIYGRTAPPNTCHGALWMERAARFGDPEAAYVMALLTATGRGLVADFADAKVWASLASRRAARTVDATQYEAYLEELLTIYATLRYSDERGAIVAADRIQALSKVAESWEPGMLTQSNRFVYWDASRGFSSAVDSADFAETLIVSCERPSKKLVGALYRKYHE